MFLDREQEVEAKNKVNNLKHREDVLKKLDTLEIDAKKYLDEIKKEAGSDLSKLAFASGIETELKNLRVQISASIANSYIDSLYKQAETKLETLKQNVQDIKNSNKTPVPKLPGTLPESGIYKERLDKRIALTKIGTDEKSDIDKLELLSQDKKDKAKNDITNELNKGLRAINTATTKNDVDSAFKEAKALIEKIAGLAKQENLKLKNEKRPTPKKDMPKVQQPQVEKPAMPAPSMPKQNTPKISEQKINTPINPETPMSGIVYVPVINNSTSWKVALRDKDGKFTGNYISTNSNWKVFCQENDKGQIVLSYWKPKTMDSSKICW